ncbi:NAD-dependent epimerase/dehydratase family protein [Cellulomonas dongxiuzhuiae]|uniref:NAD-dependent epimerase/dehydratase family protein n=1 Tax=Cellulomonas dongxiuzhuiae TaxID=2819979 RepID=A0ABX8GKW1_9CELL|nr:NAD-dependent epimerase/dehydratase family protein [Cellulomonas dongxiuzhuiae]MBO3096404.1 NAD-dependent epimerase/dehydratase family protein [Cellulomonas dongxiuzhuiae]QWC16812.1 NAD-dependent epimerase/dehydratase family protein [Cellulomonas dongxiuzhuiae]
MRVLVTGASGLLGRTTAAHVRDAGHDVRTFQRRPSGVDGVHDVLGSVTDPDDVDRAVRGVDALVHLAAKVSLTGDAADFRRVNVDGTRTLLDAAARHGVTDVVHVSSPSVAHTGTAIVGQDASPADPRHAHGAYARTKAEAERLALGADGRLRVVAVRPHLVWGPGDEQLVARIVERARAGRLPLLGHGAALIDTTYLDNAASALVAALHRLADDDGVVRGQAYVVTNGEPRTVAEMLAGICAAAGVPAPTRRVPGAVARAAGGAVEAAWARLPLRSADGEPPMTRFLAEQLSTAHWFDQRRTRADLRWRPEVSVDEGLLRLAQAAGVARPEH